MVYYPLVIFKDDSNGLCRGEFCDFPELDLSGIAYPEEYLGEYLEKCTDKLNDYLENQCSADPQLTIPDPTPIDKVPKSKYGCTYIHSQLIKSVDLDNITVRVSISFKKHILDMVDTKASFLGLTRSGFLSKAAKEYKVD